MVATRRCLVCDGTGPFTPLWSPRGQPFTLVRCSNCKLIFQHPQPDERALARTYYHDPSFTSLLFGPLREVTLERAQDKLELLRASGLARVGARGLDVGCSSGAWLEVAGHIGMQMTGVELGAETAQRARQRGLDVRTGTLEQHFDALSDERFDLITFWDVLEHLPDPRHALSLAARLLAPGGAVAATFPNAEGWYPRATYRLLARRLGVWEYPELPVHLYDFSPTTARRLLERSGLELQKLKTIPVPFAFYRETSLAPERLGSRRRAVVVRLAFELVRLVVYPLARLFDRQNALFVVASAGEESPSLMTGGSDA